MEKEKKIVLYMAPITGVTNYVYRNIYSRFFDGYDRAMAPFIASCDAEKIKEKYFKDILPKRNRADHLLIPQILGKDAKEFVVMAKAITDLGYGNINWNLGCPVAMVRKKARGSGMLSHPDLIKSFLDKVMPYVSAKLSIKVRLGNEDKTELFALMPMFDEYPLEEIIIHPRTGVQMYNGSVDLSAFESCLNVTKHRIVYSGDINSLRTFNDLKKRFPDVSGWMIGRGGIVDTFLPEKIKGNELISNEKKVERFHGFHNALLCEYCEVLSGPGHILSKMKEAWSYWHKAFIQGETIYHKVCRLKTVDRYSKEVNLFLESIPEIYNH